tara:strand:+ start:276 stop:1553 length:1278 start_codon:yes stop_codon:yes gene_type:complete
MILTTHRDMTLENFLQEYSLPAVQTADLEPQWSSQIAARATYYEEALQRKLCWDNDPGLRRRFIYSLNLGLTPLSTIILADVRGCMEHSQKTQDTVSVAYFSTLLTKGFKYISIDGKNRTATLHSFVDNEFTITGEYINQDGVTEEVENAFYKDLTESLRNQFRKNSPIRVTELVGLKSDIFALFVNIHDGIPLNEMEKRNASMSPIAEWVRETARNLESTMPRIFKAKEIKRMADLEWVTKAAMQLVNLYRPTPDGSVFSTTPSLRAHDLDAWYSQGTSYRSLTDNGVPYIATELVRAAEIMAECHKVYDGQTQYTSPSRPVPSKMTNAVLMITEEIVDNGNYIQDYDIFFRELYKIDQTLIADSDTLKAADTKGALLHNKKAPPASRYYSHWSHVPHQPQERAKRKAALFAEVNKNLNRLTIR